MRFLYLDVETIPSESARERLTAGVGPPANYSEPETIAKWEANKKPAAIDKAFRAGATDACFGETLCIGWAMDDADPARLILGPGMDEIGVLSAFAGHLIAYAETQNLTPENITIVGHYARHFDVPWLWRRWTIKGIEKPSFWPSPSVSGYRGNIFDTSYEWAGSRDSVPLDDLCFALGLPGKNGFDGSQVYDAYKRGDLDLIGDYCLADVDRVRKVHQIMTGRLLP